MTGKINVKILIIVAIVIAIIGIGIFVVTKIVNYDKDKEYILEQIAEEDYKYFTVFSDGKYGVINTKGEMIVQNNYQEIIIPNPTKDVFIALKEDGSYDILNKNSEKIFEEYNKVQEVPVNSTATNLPYEKSVLKFEQNGKFGLIDFSGNVITDAIYEEISSVKFKEGEILAKKDGKYGVINNKGVELIPFEYEEIEADKYYSNGNYSNSGYIVKRTTSEGYRYGYISSNWKVILDTEYTSISRILDIDSSDIYLIAAKNGQYGVIKNKKIAINFAYQSIEYNKSTNLYVVQRSGQYGVLDINGKTIVNVEYKDIRFNGIYILAKSYTEDIYFNKKGEKAQTPYISMVEAKDINSYITIDKNNLYGIINGNGEETVRNEYLYIEYAFDKYFVAYKEGLGLGVIDRDGNVFINFEYDVLSKIGEHKLLKGLDMENNVTDIFSADMKKLSSLSNATIEIHANYIEVYNPSKTDYITKERRIKNLKRNINKQ